MRREWTGNRFKLKYVKFGSFAAHCQMENFINFYFFSKTFMRVFGLILNLLYIEILYNIKV